MVNFKRSVLFYLVILFGSAAAFYASFDSNDPDYIASQQHERKLQATNINPVFTPVIFSSAKINELNSGAELLRGMSDTMTLPGNAGPSNNGGSPNWAMFLNLIGGTRTVRVTQLKTANTGTAAASFSIEIFTRHGNALGGPVNSGPGSDTAGWTLLGSVPAIQGATASGVSELITIPTIIVAPGDTVGVAIRFSTVGPRYFGTGTPPLSTYSDTNITMISGDGRSEPFRPTGSFFQSRTIVGEIRYVVDVLTGVNTISNEVPNAFELMQNYPNPFNPSTTIKFAIPTAGKVTMKVYDVHGKEISTVVEGEYNPGTYSVDWNAEGLASGVYFYTISSGNFTQTKKLVIVK